MKTDLNSVLFEIPEQPPFYFRPDEFVWRMRDNWIGELRRGYSSVLDTILPNLEREAVFRLKRDPGMGALDWYPDVKDGYDDWLGWWLNEAAHNCESHNPIGQAGEHLSLIGQAAVNVLMTASEVRLAIRQGKAEEAAALGMLLICEAVAGGYSLEFESIKASHETIEASKQNAYRKGVGRQSEELERVRSACVPAARKMWMDDATLSIGDVADELLRRVIAKRDSFPSLDTFPKKETIKAWLKKASAGGEIVIPEGAQRPGRRAKPGN